MKEFPKQSQNPRIENNDAKKIRNGINQLEKPISQENTFPKDTNKLRLDKFHQLKGKIRGKSLKVRLRDTARMMNKVNIISIELRIFLIERFTTRNKRQKAGRIS